MSDSFSVALIAILVAATFGQLLVCGWLTPESPHGVDGEREPRPQERPR